MTRLFKHFRARRCALLTLACLFFFSGCERSATPGETGGAEEITVAAAANLTDVFAEAQKAFTARTGVRVVYSFGATADLARQIKNGAPFDAFAAADTAHVEELEREGLVVEGSRAVYARGRLVLWTPPGGAVKFSQLEDLARAEVGRVAVAKPDLAPYGQAAVDSLRALNLWAEVEPKVVYAQNVSQAKQFAATKNADAAFLPRSLVREGEGATLDVDESLHRPLDQAACVLKASGKQQAARRFVEFLLSHEGQALFERYGYQKPTEAKP